MEFGTSFRGIVMVEDLLAIVEDGRSPKCKKGWGNPDLSPLRIIYHDGTGDDRYFGKRHSEADIRASSVCMSKQETDDGSRARLNGFLHIRLGGDGIVSGGRHGVGCL